MSMPIYHNMLNSKRIMLNGTHVMNTNNSMSICRKKLICKRAIGMVMKSNNMSTQAVNNMSILIVTIMSITISSQSMLIISYMSMKTNTGMSTLSNDNMSILIAINMIMFINTRMVPVAIINVLTFRRT